MTTQEEGSYRGRLFSHLFSFSWAIDVKKKLFESAMNNEYILQEVPEAILLVPANFAERGEQFRFAKRNAEFFDVYYQIDPGSCKEELERAFRTTDVIWHNAHAACKLIADIPDMTYAGLLEDKAIIDETREWVEMNAEGIFVENAMTHPVTDLYLTSNRLGYVIKRLYENILKTNENGFELQSFWKFDDAKFWRSKHCLIMYYKDTMYCFDNNSMLTTSKSLAAYGRFSGALTSAYPSIHKEEYAINYFRALFQLALRYNLDLIGGIGYTLSIAKEASVIEHQGIALGLPRTLIRDFKEKIEKHLHFTHENWTSGELVKDIENLFREFLEEGHPDPYLYELALMFRIIPAPDFSEVHTVATVYENVQNEHPYNLEAEEKTLYEAHVRKILYETLLRFPAFETTISSPMVDIAKDIREGKHLFSTQDWVYISLDSNFQMETANTPCVYTAKDTALPHPEGPNAIPNAMKPSETDSRFILNVISHQYYADTTVQEHLIRVLNGEQEVNANIEQKLKAENHKLWSGARVFSEAGVDLRLALAYADSIFRKLTKKMAGNAVGKSDFQNYSYMSRMFSLREPGCVPIFMSYDLSKFGPKYNSELLKMILHTVGKAIRIPNLENLVDILHSGRIFFRTPEVTASFPFISGNCEGFHNSCWTFEHITTMSFILERLRSQKIIRGPVYLCVFCDDGISCQCMKSKSIRRAIKRLGEEIAKWYNKMGKSLNHTKVIINTSGFKFLNILVVLGIVLYAAAKTLSRIIVKEDSYMQGHLEDLHSLFSSARGAVMKGANPVSAYYEAIKSVYAYCLYYVSDFEKRTKIERANFIYSPVSHYGLGTPSIVSISGTLTKDPATESIGILKMIAKKYPNYVEFGHLHIEPEVKEASNIVVDARSFHCKGADAYRGIRINAIDERMSNLNACATLQAILDSTLKEEKFYQWILQNLYMPIQVVENFHMASPLYIYENLRGKMQTRSTFYVLLGRKGLANLMLQMKSFRRNAFKKFLDHHSGGEVPKDAYEWANKYRIVANKGITVVGATEPSSYDFLRKGADFHNPEFVKIEVHAINLPPELYAGSEFITCGIRYKATSLKEHTVASYTEFAYEDVQIEQIEEGFVRVSAIALNRLAGMSCLSRKVRETLVDILKNYWGIDNGTELMFLGHKEGFDYQKRYCISMACRVTRLTALPHQVIHLSVNSNVGLEKIKAEGHIIDMGRARLLATLSFLMEDGLAAVQGLAVPDQKVFIACTRIARAYYPNELDSISIDFEPMIQERLFSFNPFDVKLSILRLEQEGYRRILKKGEYAALSLNPRSGRITSGVIIHSHRSGDITAPVGAIPTVSHLVLPMIAAAVLIHCISSLFYTWDLDYMNVLDLPPTESLKFYFTKVLEQYNSAEIIDNLMNRLNHPTNLAEAFSRWVCSSVNARNADFREICSKYKALKVGYYLDAHNEEQLMNRLKDYKRVFADYVACCRGMANYYYQALGIDGSSKKHSDLSLFGSHSGSKIDNHVSVQIGRRHPDKILNTSLFNKTIREGIRSNCIEGLKYSKHGFEEPNDYVLRKAARAATALYPLFLKSSDLQAIRSGQKLKINLYFHAACVNKMYLHCRNSAFFMVKLNHDAPNEREFKTFLKIAENEIRNDFLFSTVAGVSDALYTEGQSVVYTEQSVYYAPSPNMDERRAEALYNWKSFPGFLDLGYRGFWHVIHYTGAPVRYITRHIAEAGKAMVPTGNVAPSYRVERVNEPERVGIDPLIKYLLERSASIKFEDDATLNENYDYWIHGCNTVKMDLVNLIRSKYPDEEALSHLEDEEVIAIVGAILMKLHEAQNIME